MALAVVTVASGGLPVVDATASGLGLPVSEMSTGLAVTKVAAGGRPVVYAPANSDGSGPVVPPFTATTWNSADKSALLTLSNGNLTAVVGTGGGGVRTVSSRTSGKYYWEVLISTWAVNQTGAGIELGTVSLAGAGVAGQAYVFKTGGIWINTTTAANLGALVAGTVLGFAVDLTAKVFSARVCPAGNWNGSGTANPATGAGALNISAISTGPLFPFFVGSNPGDACTANFGASAFSGVVPSGYTAGWPA